MDEQTENPILDFEPVIRVDLPRTAAVWIDSFVVIKLWKLSRRENILPSGGRSSG